MQSRRHFHLLQFLDLYIIRCFDAAGDNYQPCLAPDSYKNGIIRDEMHRRSGQCGIKNVRELEVAIVVDLAKTAVPISDCIADFLVSYFSANFLPSP